jgi:hypothetical protein
MKQECKHDAEEIRVVRLRDEHVCEALYEVDEGYEEKRTKMVSIVMIWEKIIIIYIALVMR